MTSQQTFDICNIIWHLSIEEKSPFQIPIKRPSALQPEDRKYTITVLLGKFPFYLGKLISSMYINTTAWLHHSGLYETPGEKVKRERHWTNPGNYPSKQQLNNYLSFISQTIQERHAGYLWWNKDELVTFFNGLLHMDIPVLANQ